MQWINRKPIGTSHTRIVSLTWFLLQVGYLQVAAR